MGLEGAEDICDYAAIERVICRSLSKTILKVILIIK